MGSTMNWPIVLQWCEGDSGEDREVEDDGLWPVSVPVSAGGLADVTPCSSNVWCLLF